MMQGNIFIAQGDLTHLSADAVVYSTDVFCNPGLLHAAFEAAFPGFQEKLKRGFREACQGRDALAVGDTFWVPLSETQRPYGVSVVVVLDGRISAAGHRAAGAAVTTAVQNLRTHSAVGPDKRLLVAVPAIGAGAAGKRAVVCGNAAKQLEAVYNVLEQPEFHATDVAFITYTPLIYETYLAARRNLRETIPNARLNHDEQALFAAAPALADKIRDGECVFFVGAGMSEETGLPGWQTLIDRLAGELDIPDALRGQGPDYFLDLAEYYRLTRTPEQLARIVYEHFGSANADARPTLAHYLLLALPVRHVVTTNYDNLLERALTTLRRPPITIIEQQDVTQTGSQNEVYVIKFHGDADHQNAPDHIGDIILSRSDYDAFFHKRPVMAALLEGLLLNQTFFFIGYSLRDPNFQQIHNRIALMLQNAQQTAYMTVYNSAQVFVARPALENKHIQLIELPDGTKEEKAVHLLRFLDYLSEQVVREPELLLGPEPPEHFDPDGILAPFRSLLLKLGEQLQNTDFTTLHWREALQLERTLLFLVEQGWQPDVSRREGRRALSASWEELAKRLKPEHARHKRRMLLLALRYSDNATTARRIRRKLTTLQEHSPGL